MNYVLCSENSYKINSYSPEDTYKIGVLLGGACYPGLTILLYGGLGMGKTQITQGIGHSLGIKRVKSPTFIIISEHEGILPLIHADLYRLETFSDVDSLDLESYTDSGAVLVVEWAERWQNTPQNDMWDIHFINSSQENPDQREIRITAYGAQAAKHLSEALGNI